MNKLLPLGAAVLALALAGCGGSPSSGEPATVIAPVLSISDAQGIWRSATGASTTLSAVVLPDGKLWALMSTATSTSASTRLLKGSMAVEANTLAGSGKSYNLSTGTVDNLSLSASLTVKSALSGSITSTVAAAESYSLSYQTRYETPATLGDFLADASKPWIGNFGDIAVTWTVNAGSIAGTSTTGCTYAGTLSLRNEAKAVVDVTVNETCAGVLKQFSGVALRSDATAAGVTNAATALMLTTTAAPDAALAVMLVK
jgi:hypothetical protein